MGPRIFASDSQESCFFMKYKAEENQIILFADDTMPRFVTCFTLLDYSTVAIADKFGNLVVVMMIHFI
jgi:splicing factor 3B subunit 3